METKYLLLDEIMFKQRLTSKELAKKMNVSYSAVNGWKTEKQLPSVKMLFELAYVLDVQPSDLLNNENEHN